jgi:hypothetical protein
VAITDDWQGSLASLTFGAGSPYPFTGPIGGLGIPVPRTRDQERGDQAGDAGGDDVLPKRILTLPLGINGTDPEDAWDLLEDLKGAFAESVADVPLDLRLPGMATTGRRYYGRPRGLDTDLGALKSGWIDVLATYDALDPFAYGAEVSTGPQAGSFNVTNPGSADTDRVTLTIVGNGGTPKVVNTTDDAGDVTFGQAVSGTRIVDLRARTIVDGSSNDFYDELAAGVLWFVLRPGVNALVLTGAASVDVTLRGAYR